MTAIAFHDHFSAAAESYAKYRPTYPPELFTWLAGLAPTHRRAWDCATGSGQAAVDLVEHFGHVVATDASARQLASAARHPRIGYLATSAEAAALREGSVDLVAVAQAAHWFDLERFYAEVRRVVRAQGIVALWTYDVCHVDERVDPIVSRFYRDVVGPYWPPERRVVEDRYRTLPFPFTRIPSAELAMRATWRRADLVGYLSTWSATQRYVRARGVDPTIELRRELDAVWDDREPPRPVRWPLHMLVGRL